MRAKPSQPSDQGPAICDWGRFTAGANPHCQPRLFSIIASSIHIQINTRAFTANNLQNSRSSISLFRSHAKQMEHFLQKSIGTWVQFDFVLLKAWSHSVVRLKNYFCRLNDKRLETSICHWVVCPGENHSHEIGSSNASLCYSSSHTKLAQTHFPHFIYTHSSLFQYVVFPLNAFLFHPTNDIMTLSFTLSCYH